MPSDLTIFAATYLVFIDAVLAVAVLGFTLYRRPPSDILRWAVLAALILLISGFLLIVGGAVYNDPRPFTVDHVRPLIAHAADNGFPSDHALLAAALVALVGLVDPWLAIPFVILAYLVDWARVGAGIHHVIDVVGSSVFVAIATLIAILVGPAIVRWLVPRMPPGWTGETAARAQPRAPSPPAPLPPGERGV